MESARSVLLAGASGLVGGALLQGLLDDPAVSRVHALARRPLASQHPKLHAQLVDFAALPTLPHVDEVYLALGTTIKVAGSHAAFRAVDFDANLAVARAALAAGATRAGIVSAMGADAQSGLFYSRVKGELEQALQAMPWRALVIARPSMLVGDRGALGQPERRLERWAMRLGQVARPLIPANYRPVAAEAVAAALLRHVPRAEGTVVLLSGQLQTAG
jgi:uncharacterized protein YbjT (DUF2867 family)